MFFSVHSSQCPQIGSMEFGVCVAFFLGGVFLFFFYITTRSCQSQKFASPIWALNNHSTDFTQQNQSWRAQSFLWRSYPKSPFLSAFLAWAWRLNIFNRKPEFKTHECLSGWEDPFKDDDMLQKQMSIQNFRLIVFQGKLQYTEIQTASHSELQTSVCSTTAYRTHRVLNKTWGYSFTLKPYKTEVMKYTKTHKEFVSDNCGCLTISLHGWVRIISC